MKTKNINSPVSAAPFELFCAYSLRGKPQADIGYPATRALNAAQTRVAINAALGNAIIYDKNFSIADDGISISAGMLWNSSEKQWRFAAGQSSLSVDADIISISESDGRVVKYKKENDKYVCVEPDARGISQLNIKDGCYTRFFPDNGECDLYDAEQRLQFKKFPNGQQLEYIYGADGALAQIKLPSGRVLDTVNGLTLKNPDGSSENLCGYQLDNNGNLITSIHQPDGSVYKTSYTNDQQTKSLSIVSDDETKSKITFNENNAIKELQEGERLWKASHDDIEHNFKMTAANGAEVIAEFDEQHHWKSLKNLEDCKPVKFKCDDEGRVLEKTEKNGCVFKHEYDADTGLPASITNLSTSVALINTYEKNPESICFGALLTQTLQENEIKATTVNKYNEHRQKEFETSPEQRVKLFIYDKDKPHRLQETRFGANVNKLGYDDYGRVNNTSKASLDGKVLEEVKTKMDASGRLKRTETSEKRIEANEYDGLGRVTKATVNDRSQTTVYQSAKSVTTHANGLITESAHDTGNLSGSKSEKSDKAIRSTLINRNPDGSIDTIHYADGREKKYSYDKPGRVSQCKMTGEAVVDYIYDDNDNLIAEKRYHLDAPEKSLTKYSLYDANNNLQFEVTEKMVRDLNGNEEKKAYVVEHRYQLGKRSTTIKYAEAITPEQIALLGTDKIKLDSNKDRITRYQNDLDGNRVLEWVMVESQPKPLGFAKKYLYDQSNHCTHEIIYLDKVEFKGELNEQRALVTRHWYDAAGRKIATLDADNYLIGYVYDKDGRLRKEIQFAAKQDHLDYADENIELPDPTADDRVIKHEYDAFNREYQISDSHKSLEVTRDFDANDNVTKESSKDLLTGEVREKRSEFNAFDELISAASERVSAAMKNAEDRTNWAKREYHPVTGLCLKSYDELGNITYYFYGANKKPVLKIKPNGAVVKMSYDLLTNEVTEINSYARVLKAEEIQKLTADASRSGYYDVNLCAYLLPQQCESDRKLSMELDAEGLILTTIKPNKGRVAYAYNAFAEQEASKTEIESNKFLVEQRGHDLRGNITSKILDPDKMAVTTTAKYDDPLNRPTEKTAASGYCVASEYSGLREETQTDTKDNSRNKVLTKDAFMRAESESDWHASNKTLHQYSTAERKHTVVNPVSAERNVSEVKNAFDEVTEKTIAGATTTLKREVDGQVNAMIHPDGSIDSTGYDIRGFKESAVSQLELESSFENNTDGLMESQTDDVNGRNLVTGFQPDVFGNLQKKTDATQMQTVTVSAQAGVIQTEVIDVQKLWLTKQRISNLVGQLLELTQGDAQDNKRYHEIIERDLLGNDLSTKIDLGEGKFAVLHKKKFDHSGHAIQITNGNDETTYHVYDERGNLCFNVDAMGFVTESTFDANNFCTSERKYATPISPIDIDNLKTLVSPSNDDLVTYFIRDADGLVQFEIKGSAIIEYRYNGAKKVTDTIAYANEIDLNQVGVTDIPALLLTDAFSKNPDNRITHVDYDVMNRKVLERDGEGGEIIYRYDAAGNEVARIHNNERTSYRIYDKFGNLRFKIDAEGYIKERRYNDVHACTDKFAYACNLHDVMSPEELTNFLSLLDQQGVKRDTNAILNATILAAGKAANPAKDVHLIRNLDRAQRLLGVKDGEGFSESHRLDGLNQKYEKTDKRGATWINKFNKAKKLESETSPTFDVSIVSMDKDGKNLVADTKPREVQSSFGYDAAFNQTSTTLAANIDQEKRSLATSFNQNGKLDGTKIEGVVFEKDGVTKTATLTTNTIRDFAGREIVKLNANNSREFTVYDNRGRKRFTVDAEGYVVEFQYATAFTQETKVIHYENPLPKETREANLKGLSLSLMAEFAISAKSKNDRTLSYTYNRNGLKKTVTKDKAYVGKAKIVDGERVIAVKEFQRTVSFDYNKFNELIAECHERMDGEPAARIQRFYDRNGNEIATVTANGYVILNTYGLSSCQSKDKKYLKLSSIRYFNPVPADKRDTLATILEALIPNERNDRITRFEYDRRHLCIAKTVKDGHEFYNAYRDANGDLQVKLETSEVTTRTEYDENGQPVVLTDAYGEKSYLVRNAVGDVVWEIGFPVEVAEGVKQIPVRQHLYNSHRQRVGTCIYAMPGKLEFDKNGKIILDNLVTTSDMDQKSLTLMCNRGLPLVTQDTEKGTTFSSFNEMRAPMRRQRAVSVGEETGVVEVTRQEKWAYNLRGDCVMDGTLDEFDNIETHYRINAFRERTDEGPAADEFYIHHRFDNTGHRWFTNSDRAIATVSFADEMDGEVLSYRSATKDFHAYLVENGYDLAKSELSDADYEKEFANFQRYVTYRNQDEQGIRQDTPWYNQRPKMEPENYDVTFTVMKDPASSNYMLRFNPPDEVFLLMEFRMRLKGSQDEWEIMTIKPWTDPATGQQYCVVPLEDKSSDAYEFCLDFFHQDMNKQRSRLPSYRADGDVMLDTGHYENSINPIWYMENNKSLVIVGNNKDITGVELVKDGQPVKRIAGVRSADGKLRVDLSHENAADYGFKYVYGSAVIAKDLTLGQAAGDNAVNIYHPAFIFNSASIIAVVHGSMPVELANKLQFRQAWATKAVPDGSLRNPRNPGYQLRDVWIYWGQPISSSFISITDAMGGDHFLTHIVANAPWRFGCGVVFPKIDSKYHVSYPQLPANYGPPLLTVKTQADDNTLALQASTGDGRDTCYQLTKITDGQYIAANGFNLNTLPPNASLTLVSLAAQKTSELVAIIPAGCCGDNFFQSEEIAVTDFKIDTYDVGGYNRNTQICVDGYFAYEWNCTEDADHYLHVGHRGVNGDIVNIKQLPRHGQNRLYFQQVAGIGVHYRPGNMALSLVKHGDVIPLTLNAPESQQGPTRAYDTIDEYPSDKGRGRYASMRVQFMAQSSYPDMYVLYFSRLPQGTTNATFEYTFTSSLGKKVWRSAECHMTAKGGLSVVTNNIPVGNYQCRILPKNGDHIVKVDDPRFKQDSEGYCYLTVNITKRKDQFGQVFSNQHRQLQYKVVKPYREFEPDMDNNLRSVTDRKHNKIDSDFNQFNQLVETITPPVNSTNEKGETGDKKALSSKNHVNKRGHLVEKVDEGSHSKKFLPNQRGQNLCEEDADRVQQQHEYDLQSHCVASKSLAFGLIKSSFVRQKGLLIETRTYPNQSVEIIAYNQDGHVIWHKGREADKNNPDDTQFIHPDSKNRRRKVIQPKSHKPGTTARKIAEQKFHPRSGALTKQITEDGGVQSWDVEDKASADAYVGNIAKYTDLAGQVIKFTLNYNKQVSAEKGEPNPQADAKRGVVDNARNAPPPRNIRRLFDEAGHETDLVDDGAGLTTRKRYNKEDYCKEYYFIGKDGHVYQATNTTYDELHRIQAVQDTHIMVEFGYDEKSHRRYAKAFTLGADRTKTEFCRESWYDYSPAGRVRMRDCVLAQHQIMISQEQNKTQGMSVAYKDKDGRVDEQTTVNKDGKLSTIKPIYGVGSAINGVITKVEGERTKTEVRKTDANDRVYERLITEKEKNKSTLEQFNLDIDGSILSQTTTITCDDDKGEPHTTISTRRVVSKNNEKMVEEVITVLKDVIKDVNVVVTDEVTTDYMASDTIKPASVTTKRKDIVKTGDGDIDKVDAHEQAEKVKQARVVTRANANGDITGIGPDAPSDANAFPDDYRNFVVNSEKCYLIKETKDGRNYFFYAQKRPGKTTLMAYFGDLPDEVLKLRAAYTPKEFNIDLNHQRISSSFPPTYPGKCIADGVKTYAEIAEEINYTGYAEAIAWANNADVNSIPTAGKEIDIPTLFAEVPETASNGALPAIEMLLGSMYPALAMPQITLRPPKVNWGLIALEVAVGAIVSAVTAGALIGPAMLELGTILGSALAYGAGGLAANAATQGIAMAAGQQHEFNLKAMATQGLASAATGGVMGGLGIDPNAVPSFSWGDVSKGIATAEAVAIAQQGLLLATGLASKPDWKGFATAAFNGAVGTAAGASLGNGVNAAGVYSGVTMAGDSLIRGEHIDGTTLSATIVGSMLGSYAGQQALHHIQHQQLDHAVENQSAMPRPSSGSSTANKGDSHSVPKPAGQVKPSIASTAKAEPEGNWVADEYERTRGYGYAGNKASFWQNQNKADVAPQPSTPGPAFLDYVDGFNAGVESGAYQVAHAVLHPFTTLKNIGMTAWDGYNAVGELAFGVTTEASRIRNLQRGAMLDKLEDSFVNGNGAMRTKILAEFGTSAILTAGAGVAFEAAGILALEKIGFAIKTPYGYAYQSLSLDAVFTKLAILNGDKVYRVGEFNFNAGPEGQFWATTNPISGSVSDYAASYGLPAGNLGSDFVITGSLAKNSMFITRKAPGIGPNSGGAIEVVTSPGSVKIDSWTMP